MTPEMQQIKTKYITEKFKNQSLQRQVKWLFRALLTVAALCMIGLFIVIRVYEKQAYLGQVTLESGICVEYPLAYQCGGLDNSIIIEK